ncbi:MAG: hypothetical protein AB1656_21785 [Candidatus Omnitrophota bacterium]
MKKTLLVYFLLALWTITGVRPAAADRFTLFAGEIFIGNYIREQDKRFVIDRYGYTDIMPGWEIKKWEKGVDLLFPANGEIIASPTGYITLNDRRIAFQSKPPAEAGHLEMVPQLQLFWIERHRYMRGYLINRTLYGHQTLLVELTFYNAKNLTVYKQEANMFDVYPMTAKPFILDTQQAPWDEIVRIAAKTVSGVMMKPRAPYYYLKYK